ncbi:glycosyltransferase family 31 protein [Xylariaceae sp. FL0255]|nr:glycosyltransferase family 31 protein [Xylariaceae sp. FL0255]
MSVLLNMLAAPSSRRFRIFGGLALLSLMVTIIHFRTQWRYGYVSDYYENISDYFGTSNEENSYLPALRYSNSTGPCAGFPNTDGVLLVMKTGATEAYERIPTQLLTTLSCLPDFLLFSDLEQQIGSHQIHDVLTSVDKDFKAQSADFDLYRKQKECPVTQKQCVDPKEEHDKAWVLDKYKFLPMMKQTWRLRPGRDWYIFTEADTYVFWENMIFWLKQHSGLNPREKIYLGSRSFIGGRPFAHGGSGYILSGALLKHLVQNHHTSFHQYLELGSSECCGDMLLALALNEKEGIKVRHTWPMINGEKPTTMPYGENHWCEPILTMHHLEAEEVSDVWQFEQSRKQNRVLVFKDMYENLIAPRMKDIREDWDNTSDDMCYINPNPDAQEDIDGHEKERAKKEEDMTDVEKDAWKSSENCAKVCESEPFKVDADDDEKRRNRRCFQYRWHDDVCCIASSFRFGKPRPKPEEDSKTKWTSGWYMEGINDWIDVMGSCDRPAWKTPEPSD